MTTGPTKETAEEQQQLDARGHAEDGEETRTWTFLVFVKVEAHTRFDQCDLEMRLQGLLESGLENDEDIGAVVVLGLLDDVVADRLALDAGADEPPAVKAGRAVEVETARAAARVRKLWGVFDT